MAWRTGGTGAKHDSSLTAELMSVADAHPHTHTPSARTPVASPFHLFICLSRGSYLETGAPAAGPDLPPAPGCHSPRLVDSVRFKLCWERPMDCLGEAERDTWEGARLQPLP